VKISNKKKVDIDRYNIQVNTKQNNPNQIQKQRVKKKKKRFG